MTDPKDTAELVKGSDACPLCQGTGKYQGDFASKMLHLRRQRGLKQKDAASLLGISRPALGNVETGRQGPTAELLKAAAIEFNVSTDWLLGVERKNP